MSALNGWHRGERMVHQKLKWDRDPSVSMLYMSIDGDMPPDHAKFHSSLLPFVPVVTLDASGRPWGSILAGATGTPGFIKNPRYTTLTVDAKLWPGEPLHETSKTFGQQGEMLVAGLGIDFTTRRRNKFAGKISKLSNINDTVKLEFVLNQSIGNCPKYINVREFNPHPSTSPKIEEDKRTLSSDERLPEPVVSFILGSDTVFLGTVYTAATDEAERFPSHLGFNQRGGRPGFVRVSPSDGRTVYLPDYSGNRFMTSLGNIEATPYASLTFVDFLTGDVLYLTGDAKNLYGPEAYTVMPLQDRLSSIHITGYTLVRDALPIRQNPGSIPQRSPYSPPIRYLAEETSAAKLFEDGERPSALLTSIDLHSASVATFHWELQKEIKILPGQSAILDFTTLLGAVAYQHMAPMKPSSVNDDRIRTWTVSSAAPGSKTRTFALTMREKRGGVVTGAMFNIARQLARVKPDALADSRPLDLTVSLVGISGEFTLPTTPQSQEISNNELGLDVIPQCHTEPPPMNKLLWIAGGIGVTPFLSMLRAILQSDENQKWDVKLLLSARDPEILLPLLSSALKSANPHPGLHLSIDTFSSQPIPDLSVNGVTMKKHSGRLTTPQFFEGDCADVVGREAFVCGPDAFEKAVVASLTQLGVDSGRIKREGFEY